MKSTVAVLTLFILFSGVSNLSAQTSQTFNYTGNTQTWVVPPCVTSIDVIVAGAEGGGGNGGNGAVITGTFAVVPGQTLQISVGGQGGCPAAAFGGGGSGQNSSVGLYSCAGGGYSSISVSPFGLNNALVVAGGGGGTGGGDQNGQGGAGGCANGGAGATTYGYGGGGGTTTSGGAGGGPWTAGGGYGQSGSFGQGGAGGVDVGYGYNPGGGGGGGYYGGGGGGSDNISLTSYAGGGGGGGGSSLIPAGGNCSGTNTGNGYVTITYTQGTAVAVPSNTGPYCEGETIQLNVTGSGTYSWSGPNGFTSTQQNPTIAGATAAMAGTYTVTVSNAGCDATGTTDVIVNPVPTVDPVSDQTLCANASTNAVNFTGSVAGATYNWTNDNPAIGLAGSGSGNIASFTATNSGASTISGTITVTPTSNGCTGTPTSFTFTVDPVPVVDPVGDQTLCAGDNTSDVIFTSGTAGTTFNWTNSDPSIGLAASGTGDISSFTATNTTSAAVISTISVIGEYGGCNSNPETFTITVNPIPTVDPVADQTVCANTSTGAVNFTGAVSGTMFDWTNDNTAIGLGANGTGNIAAFNGTNGTAASITGNILVTPTANGCTGIPESFSITVDPIPSVDPVADQELCAGEMTNAVNFTGNVVGANYDWTNDNTNIGLAASGTGNIASFATTNSGSSPEIANLVVTPSNNGCSGTPQSFSIIVNPLPTATVSGTVAVCEGAPDPVVTFTGANGVAPYTITYTMNGGAPQMITTTGANATITIPTTSAGVWNIDVVSVQDASSTGCSQTISGNATVTVNANPTPVITGTLNYCVGTYTTLNTTQSYAGYSWSTGATTPTVDVTIADNSISVTVTTAEGCVGTSSAVNVTESPGITTNSSETICQGDSVLIHGNYENTAGTYSQMFTAANGCDSTSNVTLNVNPLPTVNAGSDKVVCEGTSVTLAGAGATSYTWDNGITDGVAFIQNPGTITYTVTGTDNNGCVNTDQVDVTVNALPNVDAGIDQFICEGTMVTLSGAGAQTYNWDNGITDGMAFSQPNGTITYTVTGTDANGCVNTDQVSVTVNPIPTVSAGADQSVCEGEMVTLSGSGANTYTWTGGISNNVAFTPSVGTTTYTVTGTTAAGCSATDDVNVMAYALPTVSFIADVTQGCEPLTVNFTNTSPPSENCTWTIENNLAPAGCGTITTTFEQAGCFDVTLELTSVEGCVNSWTESDYICVEALPDASFDYSPYEITTLNTNVSFTNTSDNATDYIWYFGDNSPVSTDVDPEHLYPEDVASSYMVTLIALTPYGCSDTTYQYVQVKEELIYYIPNTFTPDGDFVNQTFQPIFTSGFDPYDFNMKIFNRWGEIVYETNDAEIGWDGSYGSGSEIGMCQDGVYTWKIEFKVRDGDERMIIHGHVNLIR